MSWTTHHYTLIALAKLHGYPSIVTLRLGAVRGIAGDAGLALRGGLCPAGDAAALQAFLAAEGEVVRDLRQDGFVSICL